MKLWQKNYKLNKRIEEFTVGKDYLLDQKLVKYDCIASIAHAKMLLKIKILTGVECSKIIKLLNEIILLNKKGKFKLKQSDEDCHTAIENFLVKKSGAAGKKIHTARSRNDQVLTALRLYSKDEIKKIEVLADSLISSLVLFRKKHGKTKMPGYTHMRKAMPSSAGLWAQAFIDSMKDNKKLLSSIDDLTYQSPLGSGAGYGLPIKIDRKLTAKLLGFKKVQNNPVYVQNSRTKFESSILHALSQIMFDLSKMSSDILLFSMPEFGYFEIPDEICTGSSIMPQKKNPDVLELLSAKYFQVLGYEFQIKSINSNSISGYNRGVQLTKESLMGGFETTKESLEIASLVLKKLGVSKKNCQKAMTPELFAAEKAIKLAEKGIPFRTAYGQVSAEFPK